MADKENTAAAAAAPAPSDGVTSKHNVAAITGAIRQSIARLDEIDGEKAELNEDARNIRNKLKTDYGISPTSLTRARRLAAMEPEARDIEQTAQMLCEEALGIAQPDMFDRLDPDALGKMNTKGEDKNAGDGDGEAAIH